MEVVEVEEEEEDGREGERVRERQGWPGGMRLDSYPSPLPRQYSGRGASPGEASKGGAKCQGATEGASVPARSGFCHPLLVPCGLGSSGVAYWGPPCGAEHWPRG